jgi:hypothetical protein
MYAGPGVPSKVDVEIATPVCEVGYHAAQLARERQTWLRRCVVNGLVDEQQKLGRESKDQACGYWSRN